MDYDKTNIAANYDTARKSHPAVLRQWLDLYLSHVPQERIGKIIDLGCGTGRHSETLAACFEADVMGIDPSATMLAKAREKECGDRVAYKLMEDDAFPVTDSWADMVFMSMVFHHLDQPETTVRECGRVLKPGGYVCLRNVTADAIETFPHLEFFPSARALFEKHLPARDEVRLRFESAGFRMTAHETVKHQIAPDRGNLVEKWSLGSDSFLARIPRAEFEAGLAMLREQVANDTPDVPVVQEVDYFVFRCTEK